MNLSKYINQQLYINSVEEVDAILSKLLAEGILVSKTVKFDFDKFDIEVRLLIRKAKIQYYFLEKLQELRKLYTLKENKLTHLSLEKSRNVLHKTNSAGTKKRNNQRNKSQYNREAFLENNAPLTGKSLNAVAEICKVKPKILLKILERKLFKVEDPQSALNVQQLSALEFYVNNRLATIDRSDRNNEKRRPSVKEINVSRKVKGSVFIKATQIRN